MKYYLSNVLKGFKPEEAHIEVNVRMRQTPNFVIVDIDQDDMPEILFTYNYMGEKYIGVLKRRQIQWYFVQTMPEREQKAIGLGNLVNTIPEGVVTPNDLGKVLNMEMLFGNDTQAFVSLVDDQVTHAKVMQMPYDQQMQGNCNCMDTSNNTMNPQGGWMNQQGSNMNSQGNVMTPQGGNMNSQGNVMNPQGSMMNGSTNQMNQQSNLNNIYLQNLTAQQINELTNSPLPPSQQINTPASQQALDEDVVTPIMSVNETDAVVNDTPFNQGNATMNQGNMTMNQGQNNNANDAYLQDLTQNQINQIFNEPLPPSQQVNTPASQQALDQNVITPIMSEEGSAQAGDSAYNNTLPSQEFNNSYNNPIPNQNLNNNYNNTMPNQNLNNNYNNTMPNQSLNNNYNNTIPNQNFNNSYNNTMSNQNFNNSYNNTLSNPNLNTGYNGSQGGQGNNILGQQSGSNTYQFGQNPILDKEVINFAQADVTGDGTVDSVYLVGTRRVGEGNQFIEGMGLRVQTDGQTLAVNFPYGNGYSPILFVGDLTRDGIPDVMVNIFSNSSGGFITSYIYTFQNGEPRLLFDSKTFNENYTGKVTYEDNYVVRVQTDQPPWQYTIDLSDRENAYLSGIYNNNGQLIRPMEGTLLGLNSLNPSDYDVNGEFNVSTVQRVIGTGNTDTLGLVETYLSWRDATQRFEPFMQYLSILGRPR